MSDSYPRRWPPPPAAREPALNIAPAILSLAVVFLAIHAVRSFVLSLEADVWVLEGFAFIPDRTLTPLSLDNVAGGDGARYWTFLSYAFLHGDWTHVIFNVLWMVAFGSPLARRFGTVRFLAFSAVGAIAGALMHLAIFPGSSLPLVGASAAISAHIAGVIRFGFAGANPLFAPREFGTATYDAPAPPLLETLQNPRVLMFLAVWFGTNIVFGIGAGVAGLVSGAVAWEAHVGGFLAGLLLFALFDRR